MEGGLEVDGRNSLPVPCQKQREKYKYYNGEEQCDQHPCNRFASDPRPQSRRFCGLRPVTFFLSIALALFVVLAAGVAGSLAAKRGDARYYCLSYNKCEEGTDIITCRKVSQPQSCSSSQACNASIPPPTTHPLSPHISNTSMTRLSNLLPTVPLSIQTTPRASPVQASSSNAVSIYMATICTMSSCIISPIV